jgi:hypothetical protein
MVNRWISSQQFFLRGHRVKDSAPALVAATEVPFLLTDTQSITNAFEHYLTQLAIAEKASSVHRHVIFTSGSRTRAN